VDRRLLRRHRQLLRAAPGDRADIGLGQVVSGQGLDAGVVDLRGGPGDLEAQQAAGVDQTLAVISQAEYIAVIGPFAFEDAAGIMQPMRQDMQPGVAPGHESAVPPDHAVAVVERNERHGTNLRNIVALTGPNL
jgi:hypothetical protein